MRLWSIHPKYLDARGLVALWRESLLAQKVLAGQTQGYTHHPQLIRFAQSSQPLAAISLYLQYVWEEARFRGYQFDAQKIQAPPAPGKPLTVTRRQLQFEQNHLLNKLRNRDTRYYEKLLAVKQVKPHPMFRVIPGDREHWER